MGGFECNHTCRIISEFNADFADFAPLKLNVARIHLGYFSENGMIKAIIYDKDGTLMRFDDFWVPVAKEAIKEIVKRHTNVPSETVLKISAEIGENIGIFNDTVDPKGILCGGTYAQFAEAVTETLNKFGFDVCVDRREVEQAVSDNTDKGVILPACENLRAKLEKAREQAALFVATTDDRSITEFCLEKLGISDLFDGIYCDDNGIPHKPDPFAANEIAKKLNAAKNEIFMIGDTNTDKRFADNAGIGFVFVGSDPLLKEKSKFGAEDAGEATDLILSLDENVTPDVISEAKTDVIPA